MLHSHRERRKAAIEANHEHACLLARGIAKRRLDGVDL